MPFECLILWLRYVISLFVSLFILEFRLETFEVFSSLLIYTETHLPARALPFSLSPFLSFSLSLFLFFLSLALRCRPHLARFGLPSGWIGEHWEYINIPFFPLLDMLTLTH